MPRPPARPDESPDLTLDTPLAEPAPTRRSSRGASAPVAPETPGVLTRAELRRRAAAAAVPADAVVAETPHEPEPRHLDEFEAAARLFSFTGETPIQHDDESPAGAERPSRAAAAEPRASASAHTAPRRPRRAAAAFQRVAATSFSVGVMAIVGMFAVGTTTPAEALSSASRGAVTSDITAVSAESKDAPEQIQAFVASGANDVQALDRSSNYDVASMADIASASGVTLFAGTWVNDPSANIQWPFPVGVPISAAFGSVSYLSEFSMPHRGTDLTPGLGAEIHAIAAGTVRIATEAGGDYGVTVVIDHIIDGQLVSTRYGHMLHGSLKVKVGDTVTAGEVIGKVGQTGKATGPHLHFEVLLGGTTQIDPMPWMYEHTKGTHTVG